MNTKLLRSISSPIASPPAAQRRGATSASLSSESHAAAPVVLEDGVFKLENWLPYEFSFVANRVSACLERMYQQRFGFTVTGWRVIAALGTHPGTTPKDLAAMIGMDQVSITRAVTTLANLGMVSRRTNSSDRRSVRLRLSPRGQAAYEEVLPLAQAIEAALIAPLNSTQIKVLREAMTLIVDQARTLRTE